MELLLRLNFSTCSSKVRDNLYSFPKSVTFHIFYHKLQFLFSMLAHYTHSFLESSMDDVLWYFPPSSTLTYSAPFHSILPSSYKSVGKVGDLEQYLVDCSQRLENQPRYLIAYRCPQPTFPHGSSFVSYLPLFSCEIRSSQQVKNHHWIRVFQHTFSAHLPPTSPVTWNEDTQTR